MEQPLLSSIWHQNCLWFDHPVFHIVVSIVYRSEKVSFIRINTAIGTAPFTTWSNYSPVQEEAWLPCLTPKSRESRDDSTSAPANSQNFGHQLAVNLGHLALCNAPISILLPAFCDQYFNQSDVACSTSSSRILSVRPLRSRREHLLA